MTSQLLRRVGLVAAFAVASLVSTVFAAIQCYGTNRDGTRCKNQVSSGTYCHYHTPTPSTPRCAARVKDGSACRNNAETGSSYCYAHKK